MKAITISLAVLLMLTACGGPGAQSHGPDEVTATWTAGDDAPLGDDAPASEDAP